MIASVQNERVKLVIALQKRARSRRKESKMVLEGVRLVRDAISSGLQPKFLLVDPQSLTNDMAAWLAAHTIEPIAVTAEVMQHMTETQQPQGIIGVFPLPQVNMPETLNRVLILDAVQDPGNVGTMLRTAAAAGIDGVLLAPGCADPFNPKVLRAGMGAHFRVTLLEGDWAQVTMLCEGLPVYIASGDGEQRYDQVDWTQPHALIIGSEAHGASPDAYTLASQTLTIPMARATESLNAAAACAVILFEAARQRLPDKI
ncbi:MAG: TrmH family RNA methyltransferase [Chloroflexota bacterium]